MAQGKKTFIFYSDWINMIREMPNEDAGELLKHVLSYVNDEEPISDNILVKMAFGHMKPMLKADLNKWDSIREKRKKAGSKGGKANAKQNKANAKQTEAVNVNVNVNDNVNANLNVSKDINIRKAEFKNSLLPFLKEYDQNMLKDFFGYWSEHGERDKEMRFEKEEIFGISRRLENWLKNKERFEKEKKVAPKKENAGIALQRQMGLIK